MALISFHIDDAVLARHLALIGDSTLDQHLNSFLGRVHEVEEEAEPETSVVPPGMIPWLKAVEMGLARMEVHPRAVRFILQDLFTAEEWAQVQSPKWVGRRFGERVSAAGSATRVGTTPTNKAIYLRN